MNVDESSENSIQIENLRDKVVTAIKLVYDPEIPVDVYELGLIYEISVSCKQCLCIDDAHLP